jgi:hypothetical protein
MVCWNSYPLLLLLYLFVIDSKFYIERVAADITTITN